MDQDTKKYFTSLAWSVAARAAILGVIALVFFLEHMYRGTTHRLWLEFMNMLQ